MNEHFSALSLLFCLNQPGNIVININNSAMSIIFNALGKSLAQKSQRGSLLKTWTKSFRNTKVKAWFS